MNFITFHILRISSSQLTSYFSEGLKPPTSNNPWKNKFIRVIPALTDYSDIVADIPSGSIDGISILGFYLIFFLAFYLASMLTFYLAFWHIF